MASKNRTHVSITKDTKARIDAIAAKLLESYEAGRSTVEFEEQGSRGCWVSADTVINKALDELEGHWARSRKPRGKK